MTGRGSGSRSLAEVDRILERLVGPSESADDEGLPDIPPSLAERAEEELGAARQRVSEALRSGLRAISSALRDDEEQADGEELEMPPDSEERDLERRFTELERRAAEGAEPSFDAVEADDLERRFAELERRARGGDPEADA